MGNVVMSIASAIIEGPEGMDAKYMSICGVNMYNPTASAPLLPEMTFQFWPDTIADTVEIGWEFKEIPGASSALAQWTQNGGRTLSFEVTLSRFMKNVDNRTILEQLVDPFELNTPTSEMLKSNKPYNVNVKAMIKYLRSFKDPTYAEIDSGYESALAPPVAILNIPGLGLNDNGGDSIYCVMTGCDVTYNLLFPNGAPRMATVSLTFKEIIQSPATGLVNMHGFEAGYDYESVFSAYEEDAELGGGHGGGIDGADPE